MTGEVGVASLTVILLVIAMLATAGVIWILYQREFHSEVLDALNA